jgi:hypothetical protein
MKTLKLLALTLLTLSWLGCASTGRAGHGTARIRSVAGTADIGRKGGSWEAASLWQKLSTGDRARTGGSGKIDFSLGRYGGVLTLMPESSIEFEQIGPIEPNGQVVAVINLLEGRVVGDTLRLPKGTRLQVKTRNGVHEIP